MEEMSLFQIPVDTNLMPIFFSHITRILSLYLCINQQDTDTPPETGENSVNAELTAEEGWYNFPYFLKFRNDQCSGYRSHVSRK